MTIVEVDVGAWAVDPSVRLIKRYSDQKVMIQKVGTEERYSAAVDISTAPYKYVETDEPVPEFPEKDEKDEKEGA